MVKDKEEEYLLNTEIDGNVLTKPTAKRKESHKHFRYHEKKFPIDFVLAAKNIDKASMSERDRENMKRRREFFHNLRKKRLIYKKTYSTVRFFNYFVFYNVSYSISWNTIGYFMY